ncbi:MAG: hypothetical protein ACR2K4_08630, partial [Candidatus Limnocylindria bacterium]
SAAWTSDDAGVFYGRYPEPAADTEFASPNLEMELRYHRLGDDPADDRVVFANPDQPEWSFEPAVVDEGRWLVVSVWRESSPTNMIFTGDLDCGVDGVEIMPLLEPMTRGTSSSRRSTERSTC